MLAWMLHNAVVATVLALLVWGTCHWRRLGPAARHALWLLVLLKLLMPPMVSWPWAVANPLARAQVAPGAPVAQNASEAPPAEPATLVASEPSPAFVAPVTASPVERGSSQDTAVALLGRNRTMQLAIAVLTVMWLSGVAACLLLQGVRIVRMAQWTARAKPAPALEAVAADLSQQMGMRPMRVREAEGLGSPLVWSLIRPVLLWPAEMPFDTPASRAMLAHELAHVRRRDHWVGWLKLAAGCLWWWHPVYWYVRWKLGEEAELACDAWAVQKVARARRAYAEALLAVCEKALRPAPALAVGVMEGGRRIMERRLRMILQEDVSLRLSRTGVAALGAVALALAPAWAQNGSVPENGGRMGASERKMTVREAAAPAPAPGPSNISPAPRLEDPASWVRGVGSVMGGSRGTGASGAAGQLVTPEADGQTGSALHGGIGMGTWDTKAEFRDILVQTSDRKTLLQPYFANGLDGWQELGGEWVVGGGVLSQNSRAINCQIIRGENTWTDYTYSLKARRTEGTEGFLIIFAAEDSKNLYWWNLGGWGDTRTAIEKITRGGKREIPGTAVDLRIETGTWYDISVAVHGDTAECYFDGRLITRINRDEGNSSLPDAGPPKVFNNGNGPEPARPAGRSGAGWATESRPAATQTGAPVQGAATPHEEASKPFALHGL